MCKIGLLINEQLINEAKMVTYELSLIKKQDIPHTIFKIPGYSSNRIKSKSILR